MIEYGQRQPNRRDQKAYFRCKKEASTTVGRSLSEAQIRESGKSEILARKAAAGAFKNSVSASAD
jgi:hypothetical protein